MEGKLKITFEIVDNKDAEDCYSHFYQNRRGPVGEVHIYLMNVPEETFEKYADEEAEKYYAEEEKRKAEYELK